MLFLFVINLIFFYFLKNKLEIPTDTKISYSPAAVSLLEGQGYTVGGHFNASHPPLFSTFLAGVYWISNNQTLENPVYPVIVLILQAFSCGFIYLCGKELWRRSVGILSALLLGFYPFFIVLTATKYAWNAMPLFIFLFYLSFYLFIKAASDGKSSTFCISGFILGLSSLVWPGAAYLVFFLALFIFFNRKLQFRSCIICSFAFFVTFWLPVLSWTFFVYSQTGRPVLFSASQTSFLRAGVILYGDHHFTDLEVSQDAKLEDEKGKLTNTRQVILFYWNELRQKPQAMMRFAAHKLVRPWYSTDSEKYDDKNKKLQIPYLVLIIYGVLGSVQKERPEPYFLSALLLCVLYFWAVFSIGLSILRYMMPSMGLLMLPAAAGLEDLMQKGKFYRSAIFFPFSQERTENRKKE